MPLDATVSCLHIKCCEWRGKNTTVMIFVRTGRTTDTVAAARHAVIIRGARFGDPIHWQRAGYILG